MKSFLALEINPLLKLKVAYVLPDAIGALGTIPERLEKRFG